MKERNSAQKRLSVREATSHSLTGRMAGNPVPSPANKIAERTFKEIFVNRKLQAGLKQEKFYGLERKTLSARATMGYIFNVCG